MNAVPASRPRPASDLAAAFGIAGALLGLAGLAAVTVALIAAPAARDWLAFDFPDGESTLGEALSIVANNLRLLAAILVACGVAQLALDTQPEDAAGPSARAVVFLCDVVVVVAAGIHALLVGAGVGAYGGRMVAALLPHGPLELAAFSVALALYCAARRERLETRRWLVAGVGSGLGLALAAAVEVLLP